MKKKLLAGLATGLLMYGMVGMTEAATLSLDFNSLPSSQGWTYNGVNENDFSYDGMMLTMDTVTSGGGYSSFYRMENVVESTQAFTASITARILADEGESNEAGF